MRLLRGDRVESVGGEIGFEAAAAQGLQHVLRLIGEQGGAAVRNLAERGEVEKIGERAVDAAGSGHGGPTMGELREGFLNYAPIGGLIGGVLLIELVLFLGGMMVSPASSAPRASPVREGVSNTQALGEVIYTQYIFVFQAAGMILLIAMIGAIVLTLRERTGVRRQNVAAQVGRTRAQAVENVDIKPGAGI